MSFKEKIWRYHLGLVSIGFVLIQLVFFRDNLFGWSYTGWDTHDWIFINFLYFSDATRDSGIPLWNHFIQSGNFLPSFNNAGLYTLFYAPFVAASWVINSMRAFELMIQAVILIGAIGVYLFFTSRGIDRLIAFLGATFYALALLMPITGQLAFVYSFASLPWMLIVASKVVMNLDQGTTKTGMAKSLLLPVALPLFIASGYVWLNFVNFLITFTWGLMLLWVERKDCTTGEKIKIAVKLSLVFALIGALYLMLIGPGLLNLLTSYSIFKGDFTSPEPRLRGLSPVQNYSYENLMSAIVGVIDPRFAIGRTKMFLDIKLTWSYGVGLMACLLAFLLPGSRNKSDKYWWIVFVLFLLYATGNSYGIDKIIHRLPVLNANRWWFSGAYYCAIALIMIAISKLNHYYQTSQIHHYKIRQIICLILILLCWINTSGDFRSLAIVTIASIGLLFYLNQKGKIFLLTLLLVSGITGFATLRDTGGSYKFSIVPNAAGYYRMIDERNIHTTITNNFRKLSEAKEYVFYDTDWFLKKIPIAHGYNHISNPLYWYVKNDKSISKISYISEGLRAEKDISRAHSEDDNVFATALTNDILEVPWKPTVNAQVFNSCKNVSGQNGSIKTIAVKPNNAQIEIETTGPVFLVFNNVFYRGWRATLDKKPVPISIANRIFMGVCINESGWHTVDFSFSPSIDIFLLSFPNLLFLGFVIFILGHKAAVYWKRRSIK